MFKSIVELPATQEVTPLLPPRTNLYLLITSALDQATTAPSMAPPLTTNSGEPLYTFQQRNAFLSTLLADTSDWPTPLSATPVKVMVRDEILAPNVVRDYASLSSPFPIPSWHIDQGFFTPSVSLQIIRFNPSKELQVDDKSIKCWISQTRDNLVLFSRGEWVQLVLLHLLQEKSLEEQHVYDLIPADRFEEAKADLPKDDDATLMAYSLMVDSSKDYESLTYCSVSMLADMILVRRDHFLKQLQYASVSY